MTVRVPATTMVRATRWEISDYILANRVEFCCGDGKKFNRRNKVFYSHVKVLGREPLVLSQCQWCGTLNGFFTGNRPFVADCG